MLDLRITASLMFALEMARAVLHQHAPINTDLSGPFEQMDIQFEPYNKEDRRRRFHLEFEVSGFDHQFSFSCYVVQEEGSWNEGWVVTDSIFSSFENGQLLPKFKCKLEENKIVATPW